MCEHQDLPPWCSLYSFYAASVSSVIGALLAEQQTSMQGACSPLSAPQARWALHHKRTLDHSADGRCFTWYLQCIRIRFFESSCGFIFLVCVLGSDFGGNWWNRTFPPVKLQGVRQTQVLLGIWCNFYSSYAASVSSLSGVRHVRKSTYMRAACYPSLGPLLKWISTQKCIHECMVTHPHVVVVTHPQVVVVTHPHVVVVTHPNVVVVTHPNVVMVTHPHVVMVIHPTVTITTHKTVLITSKLTATNENTNNWHEYTKQGKWRAACFTIP